MGCGEPGKNTEKRRGGVFLFVTSWDYEFT